MSFAKTITVYNSVEQDFKKVLLPTLLSGVHTEITKGASPAAAGDSNGDKLFVLIPFKRLKKGYKSPMEYETAGDKTGLWTLQPGDIITIGDTGAADGFAELAERAEAFRITEVKTFNFGGIPHWEVTAM